MWRRISHALAWAFYGKSETSLCAEMARRRAACRFCRCVCRALEFLPAFGPGHCDEEMEMYDMKTTRKPGPLTKADNRFWEDFQKEWGIAADGKVGHQTTGQVAIALDLLGKKDTAINPLLVSMGFLCGLIFGILVGSVVI